MLLPIRHENMSSRRWPIVTLGLIAVNVIIFLFTNFAADDPSLKLRETRLHILMLSAIHPELQMPPEIQKMVSDFQERKPEVWALIKNENRPVEDAWDAKFRYLVSNPPALQEEMDSLTRQYSEFLSASIVDRYAFVPAERQPITYITASFLHGGWLHLIGNMWFLWLAGFVLEDAWGRWIYTAFYFIAGAAALQFYSWSNPGSMTGLIGASGAVAALMGAFLVRFPKMKIEMMWLIRFRTYRFHAEAYWLLPVWLLMEVFYGTLFGASSGVAHWAHVGGFVFGGIVAWALRFTHLEHKVTEAIEEKTTWTSDPVIHEATEIMEKSQFDQALAVLTPFASAHPDSVDAANLIQQIYWRKGDLPAFRDASLKLCSAHLKAREWDLAWQCYQEVRNTSEEKLPVNLWFDLCRAAETMKNFELALSEYQQLVAAYPSERQCFMAQIAAGRICLSQLQRPQDALSFFQAAAASPVPHLDWEQTIEAGIRNAKAAISGTQTAPSPAALANR